MKGTYVLGVSLLAFGCGSGSENVSSVSDIYNNDHKTRRDATADETAWTISLGNCTGSALNAKFILTANHCSPQAGQRYKSGPAVAQGRLADMTAVKVVERSASFDYAIVEVRWNNGSPTEGQKYTPSISTAASDLILGRDGEATKLVTVGFPIDKGGRVMFAEGYGKAYRSNSLAYNIGVINGNSGGAVWRAEDHMIVGMTNNGPHQYRQAGWNNNDPENPQAWNGGAAMYKVFAQSRVLKSIFPDGNNATVDDLGNLETDL